MSLAARRSQKPSFVPVAVDLEGAIARYVDTAFERLRRALLETAPALVEPTTSNPDRARACAMHLVETLEGFAIGDVVGRAAAAARRAIPNAGEAIARALSEVSTIRPPSVRRDGDPGRHDTNKLLSPGSSIREPRVRHVSGIDMSRREPPVRRVSGIDGPGGDAPSRRDRAPGWLPTAEAESKPLVERVVSQLHVRLCLAGAAAGALLATIAEACGDRDRFAAMLTDDSTIDLAFTDQLELGWRFFTALVEGEPDPAIDDGPRWRRAREVWPAWSRRVRGHRPVIVVRGDVRAIGAGRGADDCGHILRIH